jgi:hypothetical protein
MTRAELAQLMREIIRPHRRVHDFPHDERTSFSLIFPGATSRSSASAFGRDLRHVRTDAASILSQVRAETNQFGT